MNLPFDPLMVLGAIGEHHREKLILQEQAGAMQHALTTENAQLKARLKELEDKAAGPAVAAPAP